MVAASWTPGAKGPSCFSIASESRLMCSSRKSRCSRIAPITSAWWGSKRPSSASRKAGILARSLPRASSANTLGSVVPRHSASSMSRPDLPRMSLATQSSLIPVSSSALCSRLASRWRSWICVLRYRVRVLSARCGLGGTKLPRNSPASISWQIQAASEQSVLRPGTCLTCLALTSISSKASSRMCQTGCQYTPVASIATCVTPCASSQSRRPISPRTVVENSARCCSRPPVDTGTHARGHLCLVDVQPSDTFEDGFQCCSYG